MGYLPSMITFSKGDVLVFFWLFNQKLSRNLLSLDMLKFNRLFIVLLNFTGLKIRVIKKLVKLNNMAHYNPHTEKGRQCGKQCT